MEIKTKFNVNQKVVFLNELIMSDRITIYTIKSICIDINAYGQARIDYRLYEREISCCEDSIVPAELDLLTAYFDNLSTQIRQKIQLIGQVVPKPEKEEYTKLNTNPIHIDCEKMEVCINEGN